MNIVRYFVSEGQENNFSHTPQPPAIVDPPQKIVRQAPTQTYIVANDNSEYIKRQGNFAWTEIHSYPGCCPYWFKLWKMIIPRNCSCSTEFEKLLEQYPPDFSSPDAFFRCGVQWHNLVNEKLINEGDTTKRVMTLEEARILWNRPEPLGLPSLEIPNPAD